jgi:hypothetical protein
VEHLPFPLDPEKLAHRAARAIGGDEPIAGDRVVAVGRRDGDIDVVPRGRHSDHATVPAQLDTGNLLRALDQILLEPVLLQIDERGPAMARLG